MRRRKHDRKSQGHRQNYTEIEIVGINSLNSDEPAVIFPLGEHHSVNQE